MSSCNNKPSRLSRNKPRDRLGLNSFRSNLKSVVSPWKKRSQLHLTPPLGNLHGNAFRSPLIIFSAWGRRKKTNSFAASSCRSTYSSTRIAKSGSLAKTPRGKGRIRADRGRCLLKLALRLPLGSPYGREVHVGVTRGPEVNCDNRCLILGGMLKVLKYDGRDDEQLLAASEKRFISLAERTGTAGPFIDRTCRMTSVILYLYAN